MSDNLNQQFNDFRISQMDQFKGMNQFMQNPSGNDDFVSDNKIYNHYNIFQNSNNENSESNYLNTMDYYNNLSGNQMDKNKNFQDFSSQEDVLKMMEKLNLGQNNDNLFNQGMNPMRGGQMNQMKQQWGNDEDDLNQALNQISQNQNNQFGIGNMNYQDNLGGLMGSNNDMQNKPKQGNRNQGKKNNNMQQNSDNMNLFGQMNPYLGFNNQLMGMNLDNLNAIPKEIII